MKSNYLLHISDNAEGYVNTFWHVFETKEKAIHFAIVDMKEYMPVKYWDRLEKLEKGTWEDIDEDGVEAYLDTKVSSNWDDLCISCKNGFDVIYDIVNVKDER